MRVICLASQKGGSGKTTLSGHLAVQAERAGDGPVALIDIDPQGSLAAWWNERTAETPLFARTSLDRLRDDLAALRRAGVGLVVLDTPPAITVAIEQVIAVSDMVVIPTRPSPHDLRAVGATVKLVNKCGKPLVFVVNAATPRARITSEAAIALSQYGTVAPITVHQRTDFSSSMIDGRTVMEISEDGKSALEIRGLWEYLHARLVNEISPAPFHIHEVAAPAAVQRRPVIDRLTEADDDVEPADAPPLTAPQVNFLADDEEDDGLLAPMPPPPPVEVVRPAPVTQMPQMPQRRGFGRRHAG